MRPSTFAGRTKQRLFLLAHALVIVLTLVRVASTHRVFSQTMDEPVHIGVGYDWLNGLPYRTDARNPPLPRVLAAVSLLSTHPPLSQSKDILKRGNELLYYGDHYERTLARCRQGNLLFLALAMVAIGWWASRLFGRTVSLLSVALFATLPPILGHAGLATTDISLVATLTLSLVVLDWFFDRPTAARGTLLGLAVALGVLSKFTFLPFFALSAVVVALIRRPARTVRPALLSLLVAGLTVWAGYQFEFGRISDIDENAVSYVTGASPGVVRPAVEWFARHVPVPAPSIPVGMSFIKVEDDARTYDAYLFGRFRSGGFWYYFPVVFFFKTPLPFLLLMTWGCALLLLRARREHTWEGVGLMAIALIPFLTLMRSSLNLGVRHVLVVYAPLSIIAAYATVMIFRSSRDAFGRAALSALLGWLLLGSAFAHPDYLAWFNAAAGPEPEYIAIDSNLDWGQDLLRLAHAVRHHNIEHLYLMVIGTSRFEYLATQIDLMAPYTQYRGWIAVSETDLKLLNRHGEYDWLEVYRPVEHVGKSIRLYYVP